MSEHNFTIPEYREPPRARAFRRMAREALKGNWWRMALVMLVFLLLTNYRLDVSSKVEYNYGSVSPTTSYQEYLARRVRGHGWNDLHSSVSFGPYTRSDVQRVELSWANHYEMGLFEQLAYPFQALWQTSPVGIRAFLIGASILSLGSMLITPALRLGLYQAMSALYRRERPRVSMLFSQFRYFGKALWLSIIITFFTSLWTLLFVIPGIVAGYSYSMAHYFLWRDPELRAIDALRKSKEYMDGNRGRLFCLHLSYIGWLLLTLVPAIVIVFISTFMKYGIPTFAPIYHLLWLLVPALWLYELAVNMFLISYIDLGEFAFFRHLEAEESGPEPDAEAA